MIGKTVSHYKIVSKLGEGGMGVVYKAEDTRLDRHVAIKFLPPSLATQDAAKKRFINEAKAASSLEHPNICTVHDIGETDEGQLFIAMPYYEGETLQERMAGGPATNTDAIDIAIQIAAGLAKAHDHGIVHRDIKPGNVFITRDGHVKILDFGLAKLATETRLTRSGTTVGTIAYMSPEQAAGGNVDARSDLFSLGVVLYEMLAGTLPFAGDHEAAVLYGIMHNDPAPLPRGGENVPDSLRQIIGKVLSKDVRARYQSVEDLAADLKTVRGEIRGVTPSGERVPAGVGRRWFGMKYGARITVVLLILIASAWLFVRHNRGVSTKELTLAVVDFRDLTTPDDPAVSASITSLVQVGLVQSSPVRVVSPTHLYDLRRRLFGGARGTIAEDQALELARKSGASILLSGEVAAVGDSRYVMWHLVDTASGRSLAANRSEGADLIGVADNIVAGVLPLVARRAGAAEVPAVESVAVLTTSSPEAYKYYSAGQMADYYRRSPMDAVHEYERAVKADSTFALAYAALARVYLFEFRSNDDARRYAERAWSLRSRLSVLDRMRLESYRANLDGRSNDATATYREILERWPDEREALVGLATQLFGGAGLVDEAAVIVDRGLALYPDDEPLIGLRRSIARFTCRFDEFWKLCRANVDQYPERETAWMELGLAFWHLGMVDSAEVAFRRALRSHAQFPPAEWGVFACALLRGDVADAIRRGEQHIAREDIPSFARANFLIGQGWYPGLIVAYYGTGHFQRALELCGTLPPEDWYWSARILRWTGRDDEALRVSREHVRFDARGLVEIEQHPMDVEDALEIEGGALVALDSLESARRLVRGYDALRGKVPDWRSSATERFLEAKIAIAESNGAGALDILANGRRSYPGGCILPSSPGYWEWMEARAEAEVIAGRPDEAARTLEELIRAQPYIGTTFCDLGRLYEEMGRKDDAVSAFTKFLDLWAEADEGLPQVGYARERLKALRSSR